MGREEEVGRWGGRGEVGRVEVREGEDAEE